MDHKAPLKLSALKDFLLVAERGSLRAAARHQGGTQPTISRNIRDLERRLDVVLFERSVNGAQLTPLGSAFYTRIKSVQAELQRAEEELDQLRGKAHGHITVALSSVPQIALLPDAIGPFRKEYPGVRLDVIDGLFPKIEGELRNGAIDCYIGPCPRDISSEFRVEKLFDNTRVVVGRKDHPLARATSLAELAGAEWASTMVTAKAEDELGPLFARHGMKPPRPVMEVRTALTTLLLISKTDLLILLPVQWIHSPLWSDAVQAIPIKEKLSAPPISIAHRSALPLTPAAEYFCEMIRRVALHLPRQKALGG